METSLQEVHPTCYSLPYLSDPVDTQHLDEDIVDKDGGPSEFQILLITSGHSTVRISVNWCPIATEGAVYQLINCTVS